MAHGESTALDDETRSRIIRREIQAIGDRVRERHPWLAHQDAIGATIFVVSALAIVTNAVLYGRGLVAAWFVIPASAFFMSLLHELEHDLIHRLYFRRNKAAYDAMMAGVWLFRPNTVSPWHRRDLHLHHHKVSGSESDLEERGITNGERWGLRRLLMTADGMLAIYLRPLTVHRMVHAYVASQNPKTSEERRALLRASRLAYMPLGMVHFTLWHAFVAFHVVMFVAAAAGAPIELPAAVTQTVAVVDFLVVTWLGPNVLRSFCLLFVSSNMHYYGDVEPGNVFKQTQVWTKWWLFPLHAFCFNFGATHGIHHFVVRDPFYIRQMIARESHVVMRENGVRFDDFGTFLRANRWGEIPAAMPATA